MIALLHVARVVYVRGYIEVRFDSFNDFIKNIKGKHKQTNERVKEDIHVYMYTWAHHSTVRLPSATSSLLYVWKKENKHANNPNTYFFEYCTYSKRINDQ